MLPQELRVENQQLRQKLHDANARIAALETAERERTKKTGYVASEPDKGKKTLDAHRLDK